jgi:hypothetical protein
MMTHHTNVPETLLHTSLPRVGTQPPLTAVPHVWLRTLVSGVLGPLLSTLLNSLRRNQGTWNQVSDLPAAGVSQGTALIATTVDTRVGRT